MEEYNTQRSPLLIREYGRNTQSLIEHAITIEDREERQGFVESIVRLIMDMYPHTRNVEDYRLKVWSHILQMSNYKLDVDYPDNIPNTKERKKPEKVEYPTNTNRYRHYGQNVRELIQKALIMEDEEKRKEFVRVIAAYMKLSFKTWNRDNVTDDLIRSEFAKLTKGELTIEPGVDLNYLITPNKRNKHSNDRRHHGKSNDRYSNNNNKRNNNKYRKRR
ncbi:MAG: DUF4290 domain-containing protein [Aureispira sp.]|nr:DUF4290 domain-containing protein [Aureispira sp.]